VDVAPRNTAAELVEQRVVPVDRGRKRELLSHLVRTGRISQALVFTRTKHGANRLAEQLERDGIRAAAIHGNKSQGQRIRALEDFKASRVAILVATDIAARGIDIDALPFVVNYELPMVASDYVHRIGRTGRAGIGGRAVSLVCVDEAGLLDEIERLLRRRLPVETVDGFEPDRSIRPEPIRLRSRPDERPVRASVGPRSTLRPPAGRAVPEGSTLSGGRSFVAARQPGVHRPNRAAHPGDGARWPRPTPSQPRGAAPTRLPVALPGERLSRVAGSHATQRADAGSRPRQAHAAHAGTSPRPSAGDRRR
jgi:ATP-dependent RNA helicase RhlE